MNAVLLLGKEGFSEISEGLARKLCDQDVEALAKNSENNSVHIVLDDPAYVSASYPVEFRRRSERKIMAESRFTALGGEEGVGNWCVVPDGSSYCLYVLALDPGSTELSLLKKLAAEGLSINGISSSLMSEPVRHSYKGFLLRVVVRESCVQLALQHHGVWVFARRVETDSMSAADAVKVTLRYLQTQGYLELPFEGDWELVAKDQAFIEMAVLWDGAEPILHEPPRENMAESGDPALAVNSAFNYIGWQQEKLLERRVRPFLWSAVFIASLTAAYVLPQQLIAQVEWPTVGESADTGIPEVVQQRFWVNTQIQQQVIATPQAVANDLRALILVLDSQEGVTVQELSVDAGRLYKVRCSLSRQYDDPLLKRELHRLLRDSVAAQLPSHRVSVQEFDGHSLDSRQEESVFELVLVVPREPE